MYDQWTRRAMLAASFAALAVPKVARGAALKTKTFQLKETAGLRRFGFPVHTIVPDVDPMAGPFRLMSHGKPVPAQFRPMVDREGKAQLALDFNASPGPEEVATYELEYGEGTEALAESSKQPSFDRDGDILTVKGGSGLAWKFREKGEGLLDEVTSGNRSYVAAGSLAPTLLTAQAWLELARFPEGKLTITRSGPFAIGLRHQAHVEVKDLGSFRSTIEITMPSSKSWIEFDWRLDDPMGQIQALTLGVNVNTSDRATLVDFGANSTVYSVLKPEETMAMMSGRRVSALEATVSNLGKRVYTREQYFNRPEPGWEIAKSSKPETFPLFATGKAPAEGWAHVMDQTRCTAIGLEGFSDSPRSFRTIRINGEGEVGLSCDHIQPTPGTKRLHAWFHFVPTPVQVGALTSPQAMMNPLQVVWSL